MKDEPFYDLKNERTIYHENVAYDLMAEYSCRREQDLFIAKIIMISVFQKILLIIWQWGEIYPTKKKETPRVKLFNISERLQVLYNVTISFTSF